MSSEDRSIGGLLPSCLFWLYHLALVILSAVAPVVASTSSLDDLGANFTYHRTHIEVKGDHFVLRQERRIEIINERGDGYGDILVPEYTFGKVKRIEARLIDAHGNVKVDFDKGDFEKLCGWARYALYADVCHYAAELSQPTYPYVVEYEYEVEYSSLFALPSVTFQKSVPVAFAEFVFDVPGGLPFAHRVRGGEMTPVESLPGDRRVLTWSASDIPAMERCDYEVPGARDRLAIDLMPHAFAMDEGDFAGSTWRDVGQWYHSLAFEQYGDDIRSGPRQGPPGTMNDLRRVTDSIVRCVRYVSIQIDVGGWQPTAETETMARGYGDCKDMSTALVAALRRNGIEAHPVLVRTRDLGPLDPEFPMFEFNHVIAMALVEGDTVWLDPTCDHCPPGVLRSDEEDIDVLLVTSDGGELIHTPATAPADNRMERSVHVHIGADRRTTIEARLSYHGNHARYLRSHLPGLDRDETRQYMERRFTGGSKRVEIDTFHVAGLGTTATESDTPVVIAIHARERRPVDDLRGALYCRPFVCGRLSGTESVELTDRPAALNLYYPDALIDEVTVTWSDSLEVDSVKTADAVNIETEFGAVSFAAETESNQVRLHLRRDYTAYDIATEQFDQFATLRSRLQKLYQGSVKLYTRQ